MKNLTTLVFSFSNDCDVLVIRRRPLPYLSCISDWCHGGLLNFDTLEKEHVLLVWMKV